MLRPRAAPEVAARPNAPLCGCQGSRHCDLPQGAPQPNWTRPAVPRPQRLSGPAGRKGFAHAYGKRALPVPGPSSRYIESQYQRGARRLSGSGRPVRNPRLAGSRSGNPARAPFPRRIVAPKGPAHASIAEGNPGEGRSLTPPCRAAKLGLGTFSNTGAPHHGRSPKVKMGDKCLAPAHWAAPSGAGRRHRPLTVRFRRIGRAPGGPTVSVARYDKIVEVFIEIQPVAG